MATLRIEDDDDQLKVPHDEIPPVRAADGDALADDAGAVAARALGTSTPTSAPLPNAPRQIPGLAFRAAHVEKAKKPADD